jgi:hypothetical protein
VTGTGAPAGRRADPRVRPADTARPGRTMAGLCRKLSTMALVDEALAALAAAIGTYGREVFDRVGEAAGDATAGLGLKLLGRIKHGKHPALEQAVTDAAENPGDEDFTVALRAQLKKALGNDGELAADLERLVRAAGPAVTAVGERSVAVGHNAGIVSTGDHTTNRIER